MVWSSLFGGTLTDFFDAITLDGFGNIYVGGGTYSLPSIPSCQPTSNGTIPLCDPGPPSFFSSNYSNLHSGDAYFARFENIQSLTNPRELTWATYLNDIPIPTGFDRISSMVCTYGAGSNQILALTGRTFSSNLVPFPVSGFYNQNTPLASTEEGFVTLFDASQALSWSTRIVGTPQTPFSGFRRITPNSIDFFPGTFQSPIPFLVVAGETNIKEDLSPQSAFPYGAPNAQSYCQALSTPSAVATDGFINQFFVNTTVSINDVNSSEVSDLLLFPNPATDFLIIEFTLEKEREVKLILLDVLGEMVFKSHEKIYDKHGTKYIDISNLSNGVYFVSIVFDGGLLSRKFIINR